MLYSYDCAYNDTAFARFIFLENVEREFRLGLMKTKLVYFHILGMVQ